MCRLLGIVSSESTEFRIVLQDAPRSLAALSHEHPDGWGVAIFSEEQGWNLEKGTDSAHGDHRFHHCARQSRGVLLVSHVRLKTVGPTSIANTHPFSSDGWVFAHNGTIKALDFVRERISERRARALVGDTDSELFFAWFLTELDRAGSENVDGIVLRLVEEARSHPEFGAFNFLLSNGDVTYAHRFGRTLYLLRRGPEDEVRLERESVDRISTMTLYTPWSEERRALFIASEHITDEPWEEIPDRTLLRIRRSPGPRLEWL